MIDDKIVTIERFLLDTQPESATGELTIETEKTVLLDSLFWRGPPAVRCTLC